MLSEFEACLIWLKSRLTVVVPLVLGGIGAYRVNYDLLLIWWTAIHHVIVALAFESGSWIHLIMATSTKRWWILQSWRWRSLVNLVFMGWAKRYIALTRSVRCQCLMNCKSMRRWCFVNVQRRQNTSWMWRSESLRKLLRFRRPCYCLPSPW